MLKWIFILLLLPFGVSAQVGSDTAYFSRVLKSRAARIDTLKTNYLIGVTVPSSGVDTIWRVPGKDSIFFKIAGGANRAVKDSTGGGGAGEWGAISGEINSQTDLMDTLGFYLKKADTSTLSSRINLKVNISDTASMLSPYLRSNVAAATYATTGSVAAKVNISDTASMLTYYDRQGRDVYRYALAADTSTSSLTAVQVYGLSFYSPANTKWVVTVVGTCSKASTTSGLKMSVQSPTGATLNGVLYKGAAALSTALTNELLTAINTLSAAFSTGAGIRVPFRMEFTIEVGGTAGNVGLGFATVTSNAATIYRGTSITANKL